MTEQEPAKPSPPPEKPSPPEKTAPPQTPPPPPEKPSPPEKTQSTAPPRKRVPTVGPSPDTHDRSAARPPVPPAQVWPDRVWPLDLKAAAPWPALLAVLLAAVVGAFGLWSDRPGAGLAVTVVVIALGALLTHRPTPHIAVWVGSGLIVALLSIGAYRDAGWLIALALLAAITLAPAALTSSGGWRTWTGMVLAVPLALTLWVRAFRWLGNGVRALIPSRHRSFRPAILVFALTVLLLLVFGALLAGADPTFARLLRSVQPPDLGSLIGRLVLGAVVGAVALAATLLVHRPATPDVLSPTARRAIPTWWWAVPLAALDGLFALFVAVQAVVLFGSRDHVVGAPGVTFAQYARSGFWQLLLVAAMTLVVVAVAAWLAGRRTRTDRVVLKALLGGLCALTLVIVASALWRMNLYQAEYGLTRLRILVTTIELWIAAVFVMVLAAGITLRGKWLPSATVAAGAVALLALSAANPDALVAERNVARFEQTQRIDVDYLSGLSADAVPALDRLPDEQRACALAAIANRLQDDDSWSERNVSRDRARQILKDRPLPTTPGLCPQSSYYDYNDDGYDDDDDYDRDGYDD